MVALRTGDWVLIADGEKALFLENTGDTERLRLSVRQKEYEPNPPNREQGSDRPGRFHDDGPNQRSAAEDTDWHRLGQDRFAGDLATLLGGHAASGRFERVVLVASPQVLGELRNQLDDALKAMVVAEVPKTLTNHPIPEIEKIVAAALDAAE